MKPFNPFLKPVFLFSFILLFNIQCSQVHKEYGAKVKKKGAVTSDINVTYRSHERIRFDLGLIEAAPNDTMVLRLVPKGGILDFNIPYTSKDLSRYLYLTYIIKTPDGKEIRRRRGQNNGAGITRVYARPTSNGTGNLNLKTFYDSVHLDYTVTGPFEVIILENAPRAKKSQKYKIIPDYKKKEVAR